MIGLVEDGRGLTDDELAELRQLFEKNGDREVAELLGVSRQTIAKALARMPLKRASVALLRQEIRAAREKGS